MIRTPVHFFETLVRRLKPVVQRWLRDDNCLNADMWADGKIVSVTGKVASVRINLADTPTNVPIAPHVGALAAGDEVLVLCRSKRDMLVFSKKAI